MGLAILDLGHLGKRSAGGDLGASADMNRDGRTTPDEVEALFAFEYLGIATRELGSFGCEVLVWARGDYGFRHQRARHEAAKRAGRVAYVQCHLNIGASYGLVCHDARSSLGRALGAAIGGRLQSGLGGSLTAVRVEAASATKWDRPFVCIDGVYAQPERVVGICFEPMSLDVHREQLAGDAPVLIGKALAEGIRDWVAL